MSASAFHPTCYLSVEPLPPLCKPAQAVRSHGLLLVIIDVDTTVAEMIEWGPKHLSAAERNSYRTAVGGPAVDQPVPPGWMDRKWSEMFTTPPWMDLPGRSLVPVIPQPIARPRQLRTA